MMIYIGILILVVCGKTTNGLKKTSQLQPTRPLLPVAVLKRYSYHNHSSHDPDDQTSLLSNRGLPPPRLSRDQELSVIYAVRNFGCLALIFNVAVFLYGNMALSQVELESREELEDDEADLNENIMGRNEQDNAQSPWLAELDLTHRFIGEYKKRIGTVRYMDPSIDKIVETPQHALADLDRVDSAKTAQPPSDEALSQKKTTSDKVRPKSKNLRVIPQESLRQDRLSRKSSASRRKRNLSSSTPMTDLKTMKTFLAEPMKPVHSEKPQDEPSTRLPRATKGHHEDVIKVIEEELDKAADDEDDAEKLKQDDPDAEPKE